MPYTKQQQRQSLTDTFGGGNTEDKAYADWAKRQQNELDQIKGDGYSAWEALGDSLAGAPDYLMKNMAIAMDAPGGTYKSLDSTMNKMRSIAQKQAKDPKVRLSPEENGTVSAWELMKQRGQLP